MSIEIRPATEHELDQMGLLTAYVYAGSFGDNADNLIRNTTRPEWTLCAFDGNRMVSSFSTIPFTMRALGKAVKLGGISAVGTLPEYRRRGLVRRIMTQALTNMRDNRQPMAALWASQAAIYQRYQFALATAMRHYRIDTTDIGFYDGDTGSCSVARHRVEDCFDNLKQLYIDHVSNRTCYLHRSRALWQMQVLNEVEINGPTHVALATNELGEHVGYLVYSVRSGKLAHPTRSQELRVRELVWLTQDAYRSLWRFIASHDLVGAVVWDRAPVDDPAPELFTEPRLLDIKDNEGCWFRVVDIAAALEGRGYAGEGSLVISIPEDDLTPWNSGTWQVDVEAGNAQVSSTSRTPDITGSIKSLTSLYTGFRSASQLAAWGLLEGEASAISAADALFATPHSPHCPDNF